MIKRGTETKIWAKGVINLKVTSSAKQSKRTKTSSRLLQIENSKDIRQSDEASSQHHRVRV
ncbi:hypothetical protein Syun_012224 [Stephania yunnanensis]|uniref:Uncharacterized protein n=1 Tax=Stephania yunnanensis TaxID=152371 RepID=A0AAP0PHB5_9MAGN